MFYHLLGIWTVKILGKIIPQIFLSKQLWSLQRVGHLNNGTTSGMVVWGPEIALLILNFCHLYRWNRQHWTDGF